MTSLATGSSTSRRTVGAEAGTPGTAALPGSFLARLTCAERDELMAIGITRSFSRGALLMFEQEPGDGVMILLAGRAKVSCVRGDGQEVLLGIHDPGEVLGELGFLDGHSRLASVTALEPVTALVMSARAFRARLEATPRIAVALLEVVAARLRDTTAKRAQFAASDTLGRMSARILELAERYGAWSDQTATIEMPISQEELGAWAGASRAGAAHALQAMRGLGWLQCERRRLLVRDPQAMRLRAA